MLLDLATRIDEAPACIAFAEAHPGVYAAVGVHPHEASSWSPDSAETLRGLASKAVAIGEIGLDYHYNLSPPDCQRDAFVAQMSLAAELGLPISVHSRAAEPDTLKALADSDVQRTGGVMHCFTGSEETARACLALGMYLSFSGIVTFANADRLREIATWTPADRLLLETDSPYLAPVPFRGQRNEPARVVEVTRRVAALRAIDPEELGRQVAVNFQRLFLDEGSGSPP